MKRQRLDLRIAILISGELRNWNDDTADHLFNLKEVLERDYLNTTIDVYGHTWTHSYTDDLKYKDRFTTMKIGAIHDYKNFTIKFDYDPIITNGTFGLGVNF